jgi:hypothetical protein
MRCASALAAAALAALSGCATPLQGNDDLAGTGNHDMAAPRQDLAGRDLAGRDLAQSGFDLSNGGCPGKDLSKDPMNCGSCGHVCMGSHVATNACAGGLCSVGMCSQGYFDIDGDGTNGCECQQDAAESSSSSVCGGAAAAGQVLESPPGTVTLKGNDTPDPNGGCDKYHLKIVFADNPGDQFRFDLFYDDCTTAATCDSGEGPSGLTTYDWMATGDPNGGTECPCTNGTSMPNMHLCKDNSQTLRVRVYRQMSSPLSCDGYTLTITNGM